MATIPPHLLVTPEKLPKADRSTGEDGTVSMTGAQALGGGLSLYGVCGDIRSALIQLQEAVRSIRTAEQETK